MHNHVTCGTPIWWLIKQILVKYHFAEFFGITYTQMRRLIQNVWQREGERYERSFIHPALYGRRASMSPISHPVIDVEGFVIMVWS
jgi:hypothetical protein